LVKETRKKQVIFYRNKNGSEPFIEWHEALPDAIARKRIITRIRRLESGNYGDCEPIGDGLSELRMFFGPGYRAYFGEEGGNIVIMLCGGDKRTQDKDIRTAKEYWKEYMRHEKL
jgi:putative addiction module killer protein